MATSLWDLGDLGGGPMRGDVNDNASVIQVTDNRPDGHTLCIYGPNSFIVSRNDGVGN